MGEIVRPNFKIKPRVIRSHIRCLAFTVSQQGYDLIYSKVNRRTKNESPEDVIHRALERYLGVPKGTLRPPKKGLL